MRIALVLPGSGFRSSSPTSLAGAEHLGIGSIGAYLREFGHEVHILNFQVEDALLPTPRTEAEVASRILTCEPELIGMSITGLTIGQALLVTAEIKRRRPSIHVCWGSHQASSCAEEILQNEVCVDTIVAGDGEIPMLRLAEALEQNKPLSTVPGLWYREHGPADGPFKAFRSTCIKLSSKPPEPDVDALPFAARDTLKFLVRRNVRISDARIYTSKGCPFKCTFCVYPALEYVKNWRYRSPARLVQEIRELKEEYGITHFWFSDENFTLPTVNGRLRAMEIAEAMIEQNLNVTYRVLMRADAVDGQDRLIETLRRSGLTCVYMGLESGSERRLTYLDKHTNPDVYRRAVRVVRKHRVGLQIGFIMFDPLTSWQDLQIDADFLRDVEEMYLYTNYAQVLFAYPGTPVAKTLVEKGLLPKNFNYRSGYGDYQYEDPAIGRLAAVINDANTKERVEADDFFRRLRMIDAPGLFRSGPPQLAEDVTFEVESKILEQSESGYKLFTDLLEIGEKGMYLDRAPSLIAVHFNDSLKAMQSLVSTLKRFRSPAVDNFSALRYLYTATSTFGDTGFALPAMAEASSETFATMDDCA